MILKESDDKKTQLVLLKKLLAVAPENKRPWIIKELRAMRAGIKAEQDAAYFINFAFGKSKNTAIIHDLRLEIDGTVAQIDHILLHRTLRTFVLETKHFHDSIKITEEGEFLRWNDFKKKYEGIPSPFAQNERHIMVLKDAFSAIEMPARLGVRLSPSIYSYVLVSTNTRIDRPQKFDTRRLIKTDMIKSAIENHLESAGLLNSFGNIGRFLSSDALENLGHKLIDLHRPKQVNYEAKFGLQLKSKASEPSISFPSKISKLPKECGNDFQCYKCNGTNLFVQYGKHKKWKYSYYFNCLDCGGNTGIRLTCGNNGHKERVRKDGSRFYHECADCGISYLFYENPE